MITAKQAARQAELAQKRIQREQAKRARIDERRHAVERDRILRHDVPLRIKEFDKALKREIADGKKSMRFEVNNGTEGHAVRMALVKRGFTVSSVQHQHGSTNMGDFNAPCNVEYDDYWLLISWP